MRYTLFSANDKAMSDALNQRTVTNADLRELFLSRGIIISRDTPRHVLAQYFSRFAHDYYDYQKLARLFGTSARRDKMTSRRIVSEVSVDVLESAAHELKANLEQEHEALVTVRRKDDKVAVEIRYKSLSFNKSEFRQVTDRIARISIDKTGDTLVIHSPHTDDAEKWVQDVIAAAGNQLEKKLDVREICLSPALSPETKNLFFLNLIKSVKGFKLHDVSDVYVYSPEAELDVEDSADGDRVEDTKLGVHISRASLKGVGVLESKELELLRAQGFFISRIVWRARNSDFDSDIYEFEAQFADPENCIGFSYLPRGYYKYQGADGFNESRTGFSQDDDYRLGKLIEAAAIHSLQAIEEHEK